MPLYSIRKPELPSAPDELRIPIIKTDERIIPGQLVTIKFKDSDEVLSGFVDVIWVAPRLQIRSSGEAIQLIDLKQ